MEAKEIISSGLLELYATGLASPQDASLVEKFVADSSEVADELSKIINSLEIYANSFAVQPDASVKDKIFTRINQVPNEKALIISGKFNQEGENNLHKNGESAKVIKTYFVLKFVAAASIILLIGSIALNVLLYQKNSDSNKSLQESRQEFASLKEDNKLTEDGMQVVQNKYSKPVSLHGLEASPNAAAKIFWVENTGELYIDPSNLPEIPTGKQYQLWGIVDGKPVDAGMIKTVERKDKFRIQKMKSFGRAEAFAVTLETESGNKSPKGPMFVMGKM